MLCPQKFVKKSALNNVFKVSVTFYSSKRSDPKLDDAYKVVKSKQKINDVGNNPLGTTPNWELLTPYGYRFFLPGSVGPAWYDATSIAQLANVSLWTAPTEKVTKEISRTFKFSAQDCPVLLRRGVTELFNGMDFTDSDLTIISLTCKPSGDNQDDMRNEEVVKTFVLASQEICARLRMGGYWADFINPFSGRPCLNPSPVGPLYTTDQRFRCLDFQVTLHGGCKVITSGKKQKFIGSLFTSAPADAELLHQVFSQYD